MKPVAHRTTYTKNTFGKMYYIPLKKDSKFPARSYTQNTTVITEQPELQFGCNGFGGIPTFRLLIIDFDRKNMTEADYRLRNKTLALILGHNLDTTPTVKTPSGGGHLILNVNPEDTTINAFIRAGKADAHKEAYLKVLEHFTTTGELAPEEYQRVCADDFHLNFDIRNGSTLNYAVIAGSTINNQRANIKKYSAEYNHPDATETKKQHARARINELKNAEPEKDGHYTITYRDPHAATNMVPLEDVVFPTIKRENLKRFATIWLGGTTKNMNSHQRKLWESTEYTTSAIEHLVNMGEKSGTICHSEKKPTRGPRKHKKITTQDDELESILAHIPATGTDVRYDAAAKYEATYGTNTRTMFENDILTATFNEFGQDAHDILLEEIERTETLYGIKNPVLAWQSLRFGYTSGFNQDSPAGKIQNRNQSFTYKHRRGETHWGNIFRSMTANFQSTNCYRTYQRKNFTVYGVAPIVKTHKGKEVRGEVCGTYLPLLVDCGGDTQEVAQYNQRVKNSGQNHRTITLPEYRHHPLVAERSNQNYPHSSCLAVPTMRQRTSTHIKVHYSYTPVRGVDGSYLADTHLEQALTESGVADFLSNSYIRHETIPAVVKTRKNIDRAVRDVKFRAKSHQYIPTSDRPATLGPNNTPATYSNARYILGQYMAKYLRLSEFLALIMTLGLDYDTTTGARLPYKVLLRDMMNIYTKIGECARHVHTGADQYSVAVSKLGTKQAMFDKKLCDTLETGRPLGIHTPPEVRNFDKHNLQISGRRDGHGDASYGGALNMSGYRRLRGHHPIITVPTQEFGVVYDDTLVKERLLTQVREGTKKYQNALRILLALDGSSQNSNEPVMFSYPHIMECTGLSRKQILAAKQILLAAHILTVVRDPHNGSCALVTINRSLCDHQAAADLAQARSAHAQGNVPVCAYFDRETRTVTLPYVDGTWENIIDDVNLNGVQGNRTLVGLWCAVRFCASDAIRTTSTHEYRRDVLQCTEPTGHEVSMMRNLTQKYRNWHDFAGALTKEKLIGNTKRASETKGLVMTKLEAMMMYNKVMYTLIFGVPLFAASLAKITDAALALGVSLT